MNGTRHPRTLQGLALVVSLWGSACGDDGGNATNDDGTGATDEGTAEGSTSNGSAEDDGTDTGTEDDGPGESTTAETHTDDADADESGGSETGEAPTNEEIVRAVLLDGFAGGDTSVIETYVREDYIQHSASVGDGRQGLLDAVAALGDAERTITIHRVLEQGDIVATHSEFEFPPEFGGHQVVFDVFRIEDGRLAEHWDAQLAWSDTSVSGHTQVDGPTEPTNFEDTVENEAFVREFIETVMIGGDFDVIADYISDQQYIQHNPGAADGLEGLQALLDQLAEQGLTMYYTSLELVVAEGDFVLTGSEGVFGPIDADPPAFAVFYDLFRIENGRVVEHWDVIPSPAPDPENLPHDNGLW